jgi:hypothetical protein
MIKLWRKLMLPIIDAVDAKVFLEIGAEFGTSTNALLNHVIQQGGHLHCIDPYPAFDADALQHQHAANLTFYRDLSLNVLAGLPRFDVALVDGDHNWYTVYHELQAIERLHGDDPLAQPLIFVHDIGWPYGRRDLYYAPETIPAEHRQPYARQGMLPNKPGLVEEGGMNRELCNAVQEGGPHNGVLTAVEDYMADSALAFHFVNLPLFYGLGILVTKARLESSERLQDAFAAIALDPGAEDLLRLNEHLRCVDGIYLQAVSRQLDAARERIAELEKQLAGQTGRCNNET